VVGIKFNCSCNGAGGFGLEDHAAEVIKNVGGTREWVYELRRMLLCNGGAILVSVC